MCDGDRVRNRSMEDTSQYWKDLAQKHLQEKESLQREFDDFVSESQQLEREYETTIDQHEKTIRELRSTNNRLQNEVESLREKLDECNKENSKLENDMETLKSDKSKMGTYIRELEQKNDDLERSRRIIEESITSLETAFHSAIERNAILESEVDEKDTLQEKMQRLVDESRDLKQELVVKERTRGPDNERQTNGYKMTPPVSSYDTNRLRETETQTTTPMKQDQNSNLYQTPISPASRVMALNIVSDMMRRVGGLERRIDKIPYDYRDLSNGDLRTRHSAKNSPTPSIQSLSK